MVSKFRTKWSLGIILIIVVCEMQVSSGCLEQERLGLLDIKAFFLSFNIIQSSNINYNPFSSWVGSNCCIWDRVQCNNLTSSRHVVELFLSHLLDHDSMNRSYLLNVSLFQHFKELKSLDLSFNRFYAFALNQGLNEFPSLKRLEILNLGYNNLNNSIFSSLRRLISLKTLTLEGNDLGGIIPRQDIAQLKSLEMLDLSYNGYYDGIVPLQDLKNLRTLNLTENQFNGSLPIQGFCETNRLVELNIKNNQIRGEFPECGGSYFSRLKLLDISSNQFSGKIPASTISKLTSIEFLSLFGNKFEGNFSFSSLANLSKLKYFGLSGSNVGKIEVETEELEPHWQLTFQLEILILRNCNLNRKTSSNIPSFLLSQHELRYIDLSHNQLVGTFPLNLLLHNNTKLESLDLSDNLLTGTLQLPSWKHMSLKHLKISGNHFSGQLPNNIGHLLPKFEYFSASRNNFEGNLPVSMEQMKNRFHLDLSNNRFSGNLQISMFNNMRRLQCLILARNNFSGRIEDGRLGGARSLFMLDISNNTVMGKIPSWIGSLTSLQFVQMSKNHFEGEIPVEICSLSQLTFLDVSQNQLFGGLPSCFNPSPLAYLYMQYNSLSGPIPHALSLALNLKLVDLSHNHFSGYIPHWLSNLTTLQVLLLKGNELQGPIPQQLCQLQGMVMIDLSSNKLSGSIPSCLNNIAFDMVETGGTSFFFYAYPFYDYYTSIHNAPMGFPYTDVYGKQAIALLITQIRADFTTKLRSESYTGNILLYMSGLDLSSNQLTGSIPRQIGDLLQIHALNLSHNKLVGPIPKEISNLKQLESLDLSNNLLSGNIPSELVVLNFLGTFNVAYNNLSGAIPTTSQFSTYPESSYYGNPHLCGSYIEHKCPRPILPPNDQPIEFGEEHRVFIDLESFYWSFATSYIIIFLGFVLVLYINPQWRQAWFYFIEDCCSAYFYKCI